MVQPIGIPIQVTEEGLQYIQQTADALDRLGAAGQTAGQGTDQVSASTEKANSLFKDAADKVMAVQGALGIATQAWKMFDDTMRGGEAVQHATQALDVLSKGNAPAYISAMTASTHGLVSNMDLAHDASLGLSAGLATNADQMAKIAGIGSTLGEVFMNDAAGGVTSYMNALETGATRGLKQLGINIEAVKDEATKLKQSGYDAGEAMRTAMLDQGAAAADKLQGALGDTGNAWDKLMVRANNSMDDFKDHAAKGLNGIMDTIDLLNKKQVTIDVVFKAIRDEIDPPTIKRMGHRFDGGGPATLWGGYNTGLGGDMGFGPDGTFYTGMMSDSGGGGGGGPPTSIRSMQQAGMLTSDPNAGRTAGEASARSSAAGGYSVAPDSGDVPRSDKMMLAADAARSLRAELDAAANSTRKGADAAGDFDMYLTNMEQNANKVVKNLSLAQAFHIGSANPDYNPIYGEVGGGLAGDAAAARAKIQAEDQAKYGRGAVGKSKTDADLAQFDATAKTAMDNYAIATGAATPASIKLGEAIAAVNKNASDGKISMGEAANEIQAIGTAAANSKTSLADIEALIGGMTGTGGVTSVTQAGHSHVRGQEDAGGGAGAKTGVAAPKTADGKGLDTMFQPILDTQKKVIDNNAAVGTSAQAFVPVLAKSADQGAIAMQPLIDKSHAVITASRKVKSELSGNWTGTYTITLNVRQSGSGPSGGAGGQGGGVP